MVVELKEKFEKTRYAKNNDKNKKYILRGERNARYHDRIPSIKKKSSIYNLTRYLSDAFVSLIFTGVLGVEVVYISI